MQRTLILFKPDAIERKCCGKVLTRFEEAGFRIVGCKLVQLTPAILREHYAHHRDKPFYSELEAFMSSRPVIAMVLQRENAVEEARNLLGATDPTKAAPGTIRAEFGADTMRNVAHASDSAETAWKEIKRFFSEEELHGD